MARLVAGASGASVQGLREAERCRPDRGISKGSAARRRFHFFSSSRSVFVRPVGSSDVVMPRPASVVVCSGAGRVPCGRLPAPVIPERLRLARRKSRRVRRLCCPSSGFVAVPVRAGAAGRIRPADCARRSLPNQGRRQCAADASERLPARGRRAFCGFGRCPECFSAIVSGPRPRPPVGRPEKSLQIGGKGAITGARPGNPPGGCDFSSAGVAQNGKKSYFCSLKQM